MCCLGPPVFVGPAVAVGDSLMEVREIKVLGIVWYELLRVTKSLMLYSKEELWY